MRTEFKTIKLTKQIAAPVERVFKCLSSTKEKTRWSAPGGDEIRFLKSNFKEGGVEVFICGPKGALDYRGVVHYEDIVKNERIVNTETVFFKKEKLASSLITTELTKVSRSSTLITMTIQVASYCGERMIRGTRSGYRTSLRNLSAYLEYGTL